MIQIELEHLTATSMGTNCQVTEKPRMRRAPLLVVPYLLFCYSTFSMAGTLPPANNFRLSLREDPHSALPLTASCEGEAGQTFACKAFVLKLENLSQHTVRLSGLTCRDPEVRMYVQIPGSTSEWFPVSDPKFDSCATKWTSTRLRPNESTEFETRLISPRREVGFSFTPGRYTLRAAWVLFGCTEEADGTDCLIPLQDASNPSFALEPVEVVSNEVKAESPTLPDLGAMKFLFDVNIIPASQAAKLHPDLRAKCPAGKTDSIECVAFHYKIGNAGTRAVRFAQGCGDIFPEYLAAGEWHPIFQTLQCTLNVIRETPIPPGGEIEGDFSLAWGYDITPFRTPGEYTFRLTLNPQACFASPDGRFCLAKYQNEPPVSSSQITIRTQ